VPNWPSTQTEQTPNFPPTSSKGGSWTCVVVIICK
jgi:hypothetical protein